MSLQFILDDLNIDIIRYEPVHGGDINESYHLHCSDTDYFLKVNHADRYPSMFEREANGLTALAKGSSLIVPSVIKYGNTLQQQYLLLQWIEKGISKKDFWESFGIALAAMHKEPQAYFGWTEDNYIGSLSQNNTIHQDWSSFYSECRILPLVKILFDAGVYSKQDANLAESFCKKINQVFPEESPSLLHGDLWSGNFMTSSSGNAAIFDPAVYCGHREMDIGMTKLFGGFDSRFYNAYNDAYPLEKNWIQRLPLTQLYPLLVHAVLFGGHYIVNTKQIIKHFY
jgi:protein-ribulosamine 3-kinase